MKTHCATCVLFLTFSGLGWAVQPQQTAAPRSIDLAGRWALRLDLDGRGGQGPAPLNQQWFSSTAPQDVALPGSIQAQGFGAAPALNSNWTGSVRAEVLAMPRYQPFLTPDNFKMPFWLQPQHHYVGPAWFQRDVEIPAAWAPRRIVLHLERCHWFTQVWVDGQAAGQGDSLSVPHELDLTQWLTPGRHRLTIRVDNRVQINVGHNSHSVTDHTQTNWNGIVGHLELQARPQTGIEDVQVYGAVANRSAAVQVLVNHHDDQPRDCQLCVAVYQDDRLLALASRVLSLVAGRSSHTIMMALGPDVKLWDEHAPNLCRVEVSIHPDTHSDPIDQRSVVFGMRQLEAVGRHFLLNGQRIFFRGTLECCIFPLTGYPPTDVAAWRHIIQRCQQFGLNHMRFHSWCPPEAAFAAADELGFYFQVECASWANGGASVGDGTPLDQWLYEEADRILRAYGNHPSFMLLAYGNEPAGPGPRRQGEQYLSKWVDHYKQAAPRQLVTAAAGWPIISQSQYHVMHHPLRQHGLFNSQPPDTVRDYSQHIARYDVPLISHETGQWCVFPNLDEIDRYTGVLRAKNFEIVEQFLEQHGLRQQSHQFLMASGELQKLLYKEEIEVMLRTRDMGGFQLLDLHDFPGQGTALIGVLDPFWEPKPYVSAAEFRRFCCPVVPLARLDRRVWLGNETLTAEVEVYQFGPEDLNDKQIDWLLRADSGQIVAEGHWTAIDLPRSGLHRVGRVNCPLDEVVTPSRLKLTVSIADTQYANDWDVWVYPQPAPVAAPPPEILVAKSLTDKVRNHLDAGGSVLFLPPGYLVEGDTFGSFEAIFWNRLWFPTQQVHTLGILCDPAHPALKLFPTDSHTNWQWWELLRGAKPIVMDDLPRELSPLVQVIDDWNTCRKLGLAFEARVGRGKLVMCSLDLVSDLEARPVARQLRASLLQYMAADRFAPQVALSWENLAALLAEPSTLQQLEATISADSQQVGYEAQLAIDNNPDTIWHTAWGSGAPAHPHQLVIDLRAPQQLAGLVCQPRRDMSNGRIARWAVYAGTDPSHWGEPIAEGQWPDAATRQTIRFARPVTARYLKLVCLTEVRGQPFASLAELDVLLAADASH